MIEEAHVFLDTNILLHFAPPDQIDWPALCGARRVLLVVYPLLRKELSKAKDLHPSKRIRRRAGEREAWLRERLAVMDQPVRPHVFLVRDAAEPRAVLAHLGLDKEVSDDLIIAHAVAYREAGRSAFVATADGGLEMKLEDQGVPVILLDDRLRLAPEPDPEAARADAAERELRALRNRLPDLQLLASPPCAVTRRQGFGRVEAYIQAGIDAAEADYRARQVVQARRRHGHAEGIRLDTVHRPQHEHPLALARQFLREQHRWLCLTEGAVSLRLSVRNRGTLSATDVRVRVFFPRHLPLYGPNGLGSQPRQIFRTEVFAGLPVVPDRPEFERWSGAANADHTPRVDRGRGVAEFSFARVQQDATSPGTDLWLTAMCDAPLGPANLRFEILCEEIGGAMRGHLDVEVAAGLDHA